MFMVYWSNTNFDGTLVPACKQFDSTQMTDAMKFMEEMRKTAVEDGVHFIVMSSENPNSVGKPGVDEVGPDYNWTKRRGNMPGLKK